MAEVETNSVAALTDAFLQAEQRKGFFFEPSSRLQMLEKLEHLSRFSDFLLLVSGPSGAGKTVLIRQLQAAQSDRTLRICAIDGRQTSSLNGLLVSLSEQLSPELDIQADNQAMLNAIYSFAQVMAAEHIQWVIIIDNADELEKPAIQLLLQMLSEAQGLPLKPHLLMAVGEDFLAQLQAYDEYELLDAQVHQLVLEPFTFTEARSYLLQRYSAATSLNEKQLQAIYTASEGYPGRLNQQTEQLFRSGTVKKTLPSVSLTRTHYAGMAALMLVLLLSSLWLYWPESDVAKTRTQVEIQVPVEAEPVMAGSESWGSDDGIQPQPSYRETLAASSSVAASKAATAQQQDVVTKVTPPSVASASALMADSSVAKVDAVEPSEPVIKPPQPAVPAEKTQVTPSAEPIAKVEAAKTVKTVASAKPSVAATRAEKLTEAEQMLMSWPATGYTLQMLGAGQRSSAEKFIRAQAEPQKFYMFQTRYKNKPWFVVVYGQYKDRNAAHTAVAVLPSALTKLKPWARTIQGIQADIATRK
ncbi:AAA family ATPase [Amphritea sp. 1_MG-2023]|uniref:SPOR domain-containing protein n=1 Tax=Amphritea sp. 1_MG-2023 TaxID=3062670 RepID=UPI0026E3264B|nr:AAA family ATPase [Amphritea sp. 1_MG-2023]MDO6563042.1 AAA family ATPase [Amphritea sp. 1_MG-2023]